MLTKKFLKIFKKKATDLTPTDRIQMWGHRRYIGGDDPEMWYGIGKRQYHFLVANGLNSSHRFLDVACGSLRLGQYLIPMLETGNYFGLDGEQQLIDAGLSNEILFGLAQLKKPSFASNYLFNFDFCKSYDFAIAQSLFTHLVLDDIKKCFNALYEIASDDSKFYFSFFEGDEESNSYDTSHSHRNWQYKFSTLKTIGEECGFDCSYIGDWGHERNQMIAVATPKLAKEALKNPLI